MLDFFVSPYFLLFARLCLGGVFLMSSIGKLLDQKIAVILACAPIAVVAIALPRCYALGGELDDWRQASVGAASCKRVSPERGRFSSDA